MSNKYADIINLPRPNLHHSKMPLNNRAKIFLPFAALKGYDEEIENKQLIKTEKVVLSSEQVKVIDERLQILAIALANKEHPIIDLVYYANNSYVHISQPIKRINLLEKEIRILEQRINFDDIYSLDSNYFNQR